MTQFRLISRRIALVMVVTLVYQVCFPTVAMALTSGPTQPEASTFTPVGVSDMVDLFTGDFHYNIPLLDVGGYPINLAYNAGIGMDDEASWVGLGWNLNPGAINRDMRGLPDDFRSDSIAKTFSIKPDVTIGGTIGLGLEVIGFPIGVKASAGLYKNSYRGYGITTSLNPTFDILSNSLGGMSIGLGLSNDSQQGYSIDPSVKLSTDEIPLLSNTIGLLNKGSQNYLRVSTGFNSRRGLKDLTLTAPVNLGKLGRLFGVNSISGTISFSNSNYTPTQSLPLRNTSFSFHGTAGAEAFGVNANVTYTGYKTEQELIIHSQRQSAFGYLYSQHAGSSDLMDFNRERQNMPWRKDMPTLPPAYGTYDLFSASGQGINGQFRLIRNDVGGFKDAYRVNTSESGSGGIELGFGPNIVKLGLDAVVGSVESDAGDWSGDNPLSDLTKFTEGDGKTLYEPAYFRASDEMTATDLDFYNKIGGTKPVFSQLDKASSAERLKWDFTTNQNSSGSQSFQVGTTLKRANREIRSTSFQYLNSLEASLYALEKTINSYPKDSIRFKPDTCIAPTQISRRTKPMHHVSEITVVKPDGSRYIYGIPVYNNKHKSVSFSVAADDPGAAATGLTSYHPEVGDNSINNTKGEDWFYDAEELPPYATSYLLSGVLSPDYQDRRGDGITYDDFGTAVRINYTKTTDLYKWRTPFGKSPSNNTNIARYNQGRKCTDKDDKASYIYGQKELWYVHSIESGGMVAQFYISDREDGLGVLNENGGVEEDIRLQKLDSIKLFNKASLLAEGSNAVPIKTVHLSYTYELCPGTCNSMASGNGKLTLDKLWFTYGKSGKGRLNAYHFTYNTPETAYDMQNIDRWGAYKDEPVGYPNNTDFPYALQAYSGSSMESTINQNAAKWNLSQIDLPTGGTINIDYEADSYAYVQQKRAGQMFFIHGFSTDAEAATGNIFSDLYNSSGDPRNYVWADLGADAQVGSVDEARVRYLAAIKSIWFNVETALAEDGSGDWESITGYLTPEISESRPLQTKMDGGYHRYLGIPVKSAIKEGYKNNSSSLEKFMQPISKAALQLLRLELPEKLYKGYTADTGLEAFLKSLPSFMQSVKQNIHGYDESALREGRAQKTHVGVDVEQKKSWLRLANPTFNKYGGGHRVKKIELSDNWGDISGQNSDVTATYGQTYDYSTTDSIFYDGNMHHLTISSGVAAWEPGFGGEENLWKEPMTYRDKIKLAPDNSYYVETPFLEGLYPAAVVGYSQVKVQSIHGDNSRTSPGWTVNEYYTAKDFPVIVDFTNAEKLSNRTGKDKIKKIFKIFSKDYLTVSQGFSIEVNDMHGKMKSEKNYAQNGSLIASTIYDYKIFSSSRSDQKSLVNDVMTVDKFGNISDDQQLGLDVEMWRDYRQEQTISQNFGFAINTDAFAFSIFPIILGVALGMIQKEDVRFRSVVNTKFIKRHGILDKITKMQDGSTITTENILYDAESGNVLATKTQNEFDDPIYQFTYPAHWVYDGMKRASVTAGAWFEYIEFINGVPYRNVPGSTSVPLSGFDQMFVEGDEVLLLPSKIRWGAISAPTVLTAYSVGTNQIRFHAPNGEVYHTPGSRYFIKVIRSGNRNMADMPVGTIVSKTDPRDEDNIHTWANDPTTQIVDASANTFKDLWQRDCFDCSGSSSGGGGGSSKSGAESMPFSDAINPYVYGMKGNWRVDNTFVHHRNRTAGLLAGNTDIRTMGMTDGFEPFWLGTSSTDCTVNSEKGPNWINSSTASIYDFKGNQIEEYNALGIFSSAQYGFFHNLNKSVVHNAKFRETAFDHFEDYSATFPFRCDEVLPCDSLIRQYNVFTGGTISDIHMGHTGKYALQVPNNGSAFRTFGYKTSDGTDFLTELDEYTYGPGVDNCIAKESLSPGKHIVSVWTKLINCPIEISNLIYVKVYATEPGGSPYQIGSSIQVAGNAPTIEGWRRIYGTVDIPSGLPAGTTIKVELDGNVVYSTLFDDFRIHPFLANMKSFVHDPTSFRLMATLDENNYATFYEYDDEGMLIRVKRETERGIMTIQEHRNSLRPNN